MRSRKELILISYYRFKTNKLTATYNLLKMKNNILPLLVGLFLLNLPMALYSQEEWTAEKILDYKNIEGTAISPDGKNVAYVVRKAVTEGEKSEYNSQIWVAAADGSFNAQYTQGDKSSTSPQYSPDGSQIAFLSSRSGDKSQLYLIRVLGGEAKKITDGKTDVGSFSWSPDGGSIAFLSKDAETEEEEKRKKEKKDVIIVDTEFKNNHLYRVKIQRDSFPVQQLTSGDFHVTAFDWAPDAGNLVFSHATDPTINTAFTETDISLVPADSGSVRSLVKRPGVDKNPMYSPDGQMIAFTSHGGQPEAVGLSDIYVVSASGGAIRALEQTPDRNGDIVGWSADGSQLFIEENDRTSRTLYKLALTKKKRNSATIERLTSSEGVATGFSVSKKGERFSYVYQEPNMPEEVYIADLQGRNPKKISSVNKDYQPGKLGKTELISWKSTDGMSIEGLLTYPIKYEEGKKYPVILQIHGGPAGVFSKNYTGQPGIYMTQLFAKEGYLILRPNPRGSTGYGKEFRYANVKDWGFGDYQDLITGVDHLLKTGIADEDHQYVMGWSYGGFMTSWVVTQTDRFRAASMGAGLPNLISMVTTTDIGAYIVAHLGGGNFWENYEEYQKHSPINYFQNVVTPTQVIHGANDLRVPFSQGQEFYNALKLKGVDTEMIVYPRTPHGPREPKFLMDVTPRILNWFSTYRSN